jgi:hypothetical protein
MPSLMAWYYHRHLIDHTNIVDFRILKDPTVMQSNNWTGICCKLLICSYMDVTLTYLWCWIKTIYVRIRLPVNWKMCCNQQKFTCNKVLSQQLKDRLLVKENKLVLSVKGDSLGKARGYSFLAGKLSWFLSPKKWNFSL